MQLNFSEINGDGKKENTELKKKGKSNFSQFVIQIKFLKSNGFLTKNIRFYFLEKLDF